MTDQASTPNSPPTSPAPSGGGYSAKEIEEGKVLSAISYIFWPVVLVALIQRNNGYALYHAKQVLAFVICVFAMIIPLTILSFIPLVGCVIAIVQLGLMLAFFALAIMGLLNALNGKAVPLPVIGRFGEQWFTSLNKI
jgi:uncharacterized membrane protein